MTIENMQKKSSMSCHCTKISHSSKKRLKLGDYQLKDWIIERKTLPDLVQSLCDGRLFSQVARLAQSPNHTALLIEGCTQDIAYHQIRREALIGAMCSITINFHIPILRSLSQTETAKILYFTPIS